MPDLDPGPDSGVAFALDYGEDGGRTDEPDPTVASDEEKSQHAEWAKGQYKLEMRTLQPLYNELRAMLDEDGRLTQTTPCDINKLKYRLKDAINEAHEVTRRDQKIRFKRTQWEKDNWSAHISTPGSLIRAPILEPLGNSGLPVSDDSRISTPGGAIISKDKPQIIVCLMAETAITVVIGSRQGRAFTEEQVRRKPGLEKQFLRLVKAGQQQGPSSNGLGAVEVTGGNFAVRESSVLDGAVLNVIRYQDIKSCYDGSHLHQESIQPLIQFLHNNTIEKLENLAGAHGLSLRNSLTFNGRLTDRQAMTRNLHFSELDAREREENLRSSQIRRTSHDHKQLSHGMTKSATSGVGSEIGGTMPAFSVFEDLAVLPLTSGINAGNAAPGTITVAAGRLQGVSIMDTRKRARDEVDSWSGAGRSDKREDSQRSRSAKRPNRGAQNADTEPRRKSRLDRSGQRMPQSHPSRNSTAKQPAARYRAARDIDLGEGGDGADRNSASRSAMRSELLRRDSGYASQGFNDDRLKGDEMRYGSYSGGQRDQHDVDVGERQRYREQQSSPGAGYRAAQAREFAQSDQADSFIYAGESRANGQGNQIEGQRNGSGIEHRELYEKERQSDWEYRNDRGGSDTKGWQGSVRGEGSRRGEKKVGAISDTNTTPLGKRR